MTTINRKSGSGRLQRYWTRFWMCFAGPGFWGRIASRFAAYFAPPHKDRVPLSKMNPKGYFEPNITIHHSDLTLGKHVFLGERVLILQRKEGGRIEIGDNVYIYKDTNIETGWGGYVTIGDKASIHPRCQINAYVAPIHIGHGVMIAPNCALYSYNHGIAPDKPIREQPLVSDGGVIIDDEAWLGVGCVVLSGVRIGKGAVIGAGSLVTQDIPDQAIAMGNPARVVKYRSELQPKKLSEKARYG